MHIGVIFYIIILNLEVFFIIKLIPGAQTIPLSPLSFRSLSLSLDLSLPLSPLSSSARSPSSALIFLLFSLSRSLSSPLSSLLSRALSISLFPSLLSPLQPGHPAAHSPFVSAGCISTRGWEDEIGSETMRRVWDASEPGR